MAEYISKPVQIKAVQLNYQNWGEVCDLLGTAIGPHNPGYYIKPGEESSTCGESGDGEGFLAVNVTTMHGETAVVRHGDYIIPDGKPGTFYPCKPEMFEAKYQSTDVKTAEQAYADALIWYANANYPDDGSGRPVEAYRRHAKEVLAEFYPI